MDRISKAFVFAFIGITFFAVALAFPILWWMFGAFVAGTFVGGGAEFYTVRVAPYLFKQFRKPQKTKTPSRTNGKRKVLNSTKSKGRST